MSECPKVHFVALRFICICCVIARKKCCKFPTRFDTNWAVQPQKMMSEICNLNLGSIAGVDYISGKKLIYLFVLKKKSISFKT